MSCHVGAQIVRTLPEERWRSFVAQHPQANVFHSPEMFQVFAETKGHQPTLWAALDRNQSLLALLLPVEVTLADGILRRLTTRAIAYGGVLCSSSPESEEALVMLLQAYGRVMAKRVLFTELRNLSDLSSRQQALQGCGFQHEDHLNYLIRLDRDPEAVLQSIGRRTRKQIRRGQRHGQVKVEEIHQRDQLPLWYDLLQRTYRSARIPLADRTLFEAAFDVLYPRGMIKFLLAKVGPNCAAASAELIFKDVIYGWYSGVDRAFGSHVPSELLMWHVLRWGAENGYRLYDFGGAGRPDEEYGVRDFKAKFGGQLVCYGRNTCVHAPRLLWLSQRVYGTWRRWPLSVVPGQS